VREKTTTQKKDEGANLHIQASNQSIKKEQILHHNVNEVDEEVHTQTPQHLHHSFIA
jgi:hypothetical protein